MSAFGNGNPFFNTVLSLTAIKTWLQAQALTFTGTFTISKTAQAGAAETLVEISTSDAGTTTTGLVQIANATSTDSSFAPWWKSYAPSTSANLFYSYGATDSSTNPVQAYDARTAANAAIATRPLFAWGNNGSRRMTLWEAGLMIGSGTSTAAAAKLEVQDATPNSQIAFGTAADQGFLYSGTTATYLAYAWKNVSGSFQARQTAPSMIGCRSDGINFYVDSGKTIGTNYTPTVAATLNGTGFGVGATPGCKGDFAGTIRTTASNTPSSGDGMEFRYDTGGFYGLIIGYNRSTSTYREIQINGLRTVLLASGTTALTAEATKVTLNVPHVLKTCTTGTRPAASLGTGAEVYDTTISKPIFSNGASWLDAAGAAA